MGPNTLSLNFLRHKRYILTSGPVLQGDTRVRKVLFNFSMLEMDSNEKVGNFRPLTKLEGVVSAGLFLVGKVERLYRWEKKCKTKLSVSPPPAARYTAMKKKAIRNHKYLSLAEIGSMILWIICSSNGIERF